MKSRIAFGLVLMALGLLCTRVALANPDSLRSVLLAAPDDRARIDALIDLGMEMVNYDLDSALSTAELAISLSSRTDAYKQYEAQRLRLIASYYRGEYGKAIESGLINRSLIDDADSAKLSAVFNNLGLMYMANGDYHPAEAYFDSALSRLPDGEAGLQGKIDLYTNLSILDREIGDIQSAIDRCYRALDLFDPESSPENAAALYQNISQYAVAARDFDLASNYAWMALRMKRKNDFQNTLGSTLSTLGDIHLESNRLDSAEFYYLATLEQERKMKNPNGEGKVLHSLAGTYRYMGDLDRALDYVIQADSIKSNYGTESEYLNTKFLKAGILIRMGRLEEGLAEMAYLQDRVDTSEVSVFNRELFREWSYIEELRGRPRMALAYERKAYDLQNKILDDERVRAMVAMEARYRGKLKDAEIETLHTRAALAAVDLKRQRLYMLLAIGGSVVFASMLLMAYRQMRQRRKIHLQEKLALERERELTALRSMMAGEENERSRISKELHDGLSAHLASIRMKLSRIRHKSETLLNDPNFDWAVSSLDEACGEVRRIAHDMAPRVLEQYGLVEALGDFLKSMDGTNGVKMHFNHKGMEERIGKRAERTIFRIVQELINNAVKHSRASEVFVILAKNDGRLTLKVEDNGTGFDVDNPGGSGMGMDNLMSRVDMLGGTLNIEATPERGTLVFIEIRLKKEVEA